MKLSGTYSNITWHVWPNKNIFIYRFFASELVKMVLKEVYLNGKIKDSNILSVRYNIWFNLDFQCLFITVFIGGMAWP